MLKLLDYGKPNPFSGIIGRPRNLAWPVHVYRVTLPKVSNDGDGLNAFERVILKLLDLFGVLHADDLAGPLGDRGDLGDRDRRSVRGENRMRGADRVQLFEDRPAVSRCYFFRSKLS